MKKPKKILAHVCCAVDAIYFLKRLREDYPDSEIVAYFYDPNIHPYEEYLLRLKESERACRMLDIQFIEGDYNFEGWLRRVKGFENEPEKGARCVICFDDRLDSSVKKAKELGCDAFTTTLLMSPKKSQEQLLKVGRKLADKYGIEYLHRDYRKGGGVQEMNRLVKEKGIWRQDYCGCLFALVKQKGERAFLDTVGFFGRLPGTKEEHLFIRQMAVVAQMLDLPTEETEFTILGWYPVRGLLKSVKTGEVVPSLIKPFSAPIRGKVRAEVQRKVGNKLFLSKQNVVIELSEEPKGYPITGTEPSNPTFVVAEKYGKLLEEGRVEAILDVRVEFTKSRNLIVGDVEKTSTIWTVAADTLFDGTGVSPEEAEKFLVSKKREIKEGREAVVFLGAESYGMGSKFLLDVYPEAKNKLKKAPLKGNF